MFFTRFILFLFMVFCSGFSAHGQNITNQEKAVFAFFKLTKGTPNYQQLVETLKEYQKEESKYFRSRIYDREKMRLSREFGEYDVEKDYIQIKTNIYFQLTRDFGQPMFSFRFISSARDRTPYFPYLYGNEWVTFFVDELSNFSFMVLKNGQYEKVKDIFNEKQVYEGSVDLYLKPVEANDSEPLLLDGITHWPVAADIARIEFTYKNPRRVINEPVTLGSYKAPWYEEPLEEKKIIVLD